MPGAWLHDVHRVMSTRTSGPAGGSDWYWGYFAVRTARAAAASAFSRPTIRALPSSRTHHSVDHYSDDWTTLWWVRLDGNARIVGREEAEVAAALAALTAKYPQYQADPPAGPLVRVDITRWSSWSHAAAQ